MTTGVEQIEKLAAVMTRLPERDQAFARSLLGHHARRGALSDAQWSWVGELIAKAEPDRPAVDLSPVVAMFRRAAERVGRPTIVLGTSAARSGEIAIRSPRGRSSGADSLIIIDYARDDFLGRIDPDGKLRLAHANLAPGAERVLVDLLVRFATDPAGVAAAEGRASGRCSFCARALTDRRSVGVGYGPVCASNFGLPWGDAAAAAGDLFASEETR